MKDKLEKIKQIKAKRLTIGIIAIVIIIIILSAILIINNKKNTEEQNMEEAIEIALDKFKELGEDVGKEDVETIKIQRKGDIYYYISAKENTVEVRESDNKITRINSAPVE